MSKLINIMNMHILISIMGLITLIVIIGAGCFCLYHKVYDNYLRIGVSKRLSSSIALLGVLLLITTILWIYYIII